MQATRGSYERYQERNNGLVRDTLDAMECQPIFFIGSGLSKRYFGAPNWRELLTQAASMIGLSDEEFAYYHQKANGNLIELGSMLEELAFEWAWTTGRERFPVEYFSVEAHRSIFLKKMCCDIISSLTPPKDDIGKVIFAEEIELLRKTNPHAIITTNYDSFVESVFPDYEPIVGERVIRSNLNLFGEIFKIHGSVSEPETIVLTSTDYDNYRQKKKYISSKLLTYLAEHPVFIFGYGFGDPNVNGIIQDVGEIIGGSERFIQNIFYVQWHDQIDDKVSLRDEYVIGSGDGQYRVRAIVATEFDWIFRSISQERELKPINTKLLRALASRTYKLIRSDIPRRKFEVDYGTLEAVLDNQGELPRLLGIVAADNSNLNHPFVLTQVGSQLGFPGWHGARRLIERIFREKGVNITASDNIYHCAVRSGNKENSVVRKYSKEAVILLKKVRDGLEYSIKL